MVGGSKQNIVEVLDFDEPVSNDFQNGPLSSGNDALIQVSDSGDLCKNLIGNI